MEESGLVFVKLVILLQLVVVYIPHAPNASAAAAIVWQRLLRRRRNGFPRLLRFRLSLLFLMIRFRICGDFAFRFVGHRALQGYNIFVGEELWMMESDRIDASKSQISYRHGRYSCASDMMLQLMAAIGGAWRRLAKRYGMKKLEIQQMHAQVHITYPPIYNGVYAGFLTIRLWANFRRKVLHLHSYTC